MRGDGINLRISGPTPLPDGVREALGRQMLSHRSAAFRALLQKVVEGLRPVYGARTSQVLPFTASGTGGLEAAIVNTVAPGARVLAVRGGHFGERFAEVAEHHGAEVIPFDVEWGRAVDPEDLRRRLREAAPVAAVLLTHNETSTGVLNPLPEIAAAVREESGALLLVDVVSSVGVTAIDMDELGVDVVVGVTQKGLMAPPGLALVAVSERALSASRTNGVRRYYFDFGRMAAAVAGGSTTYTPSIPCFFALEASLSMIAEEGLPQVFARHRDLAACCRDGLGRLGLRPFADPAHASPAISAFLVPEGLSAGELRRRLESEHGVYVAQGRARLKDRLLRVGHLGFVARPDIDHVIEAFASILAQGVAQP
jgi:aspartate aminotransferase-like enzyme